MPDNMQSFVSLWNALARVVAAATVIISITFLNAQSNNAPFISIMLCTKYMFFITMIFSSSKLYKMQNIIRYLGDIYSHYVIYYIIGIQCLPKNILTLSYYIF